MRNLGRFSSTLAIFLLTAVAVPGALHGQAGSVRFAASAVPVDEGAGFALVVVQRQGGDDGAISVEYTTTGGNATPGLDYTMTSGTLSWPNNDDDDRMIQVPIIDDALDELPETFRVTLSNPTGGATLGIPSTTTVTIFDDDDVGLCTAGPTVLCLSQGRFRVTATWRTQSGASGQAMAFPLTSDTGYFWFFSAQNVELIVKVVNACGPAFQRYWVFLAGLTNVEVQVRVEDTEANEAKIYDNPLGRPFPPIQDTNAFVTCP